MRSMSRARATCSRPRPQPGNDRFLFTSTTSLMITEAIRAGKAGGAAAAAWLDEDFGPLAPRNVYGVTKLEAERLCRRAHDEHGLAVLVLRTGRFFPEEDDTHRALCGPNIKANEFLNRRLTVEDAADGACRGAGAGAGARLRHLHPLRAAALRAGGVRGADRRRAGGDRAPFPGCARRSTPRAGLVAAGFDRPGLRSVAGASAGSASAAAPISRAVLDALRDGARIALRPRSLLCLARRKPVSKGAIMLKRIAGDHAGLARR